MGAQQVCPCQLVVLSSMRSPFIHGRRDGGWPVWQWWVGGWPALAGFKHCCCAAVGAGTGWCSVSWQHLPEQVGCSVHRAVLLRHAGDSGLPATVATAGTQEGCCQDSTARFWLWCQGPVGRCAGTQPNGKHHQQGPGLGQQSATGVCSVSWGACVKWLMQLQQTALLLRLAVCGSCSW